MKYTRIPKNTFDELQMNAGMILNKFDVTGETEVQDEDIVTATTGGVHVICEPTYSDLGEDVDNCPNNTKELKHLDGWNCSIEFNALRTSPEAIKTSLGAADIDGTNTSKIVPRKDLSQEDYHDVWWVGDRADGGFVAVRLINALSTGGFDLQTTKNGKGQNTMTLTGHVSIDDQDTMPMEFYSIDPDDIVVPEITLNKRVLNMTVGGTATLTAKKIPSSASVTWSSGSTSVAEVTSGGVVTAAGAGDTIITAQIAVDGVEYTDTCTVIVTAAESNP